MPDLANETPPSRYEIALQSLRDFVALGKDRVRDEREALNALPGYREALAQANSSEEARLRMIELTPQVATIQGEYSGRDENRVATSERLVVIFSGLDAADIRRLFREVATDEELSLSLAFPIVCSFLARSNNSEAAIPLIERLQSPVPVRPQYKCKNVWERCADTVAKHTLLRSMERETDELYRALDRRTTLRLLGHLQDRRAEAAIRLFLRDSDAEVRKVAQEALWSIAV